MPVHIQPSDDDLRALWDWNFTKHRSTAAATKKMEGLRATAKAMKDAIIVMSPHSRERSLSLTSLEQALFYAIAAVGRNETTDAEAPADDRPDEDKALDREGEPQEALPADGSSRIVEDFTYNERQYMATYSDSEGMVYTMASRGQPPEVIPARLFQRAYDAVHPEQSTNDKETK